MHEFITRLKKSVHNNDNNSDNDNALPYNVDNNLDGDDGVVVVVVVMMMTMMMMMTTTTTTTMMMMMMMKIKERNTINVWSYKIFCTLVYVSVVWEPRSRYREPYIKD